MRTHTLSQATRQPKWTPKGNPETSLKFPGGPPDLGHRVIFAAALGNFLHSITSASTEHRRSGKEWYPRVHEAVAKEVARGMLSGHSDPHWAGSALVAAVSPGMDFEENNIHALSEMRGISSRQWDELLGISKRKNALDPESARQAYFGNTSIKQAALPQIQKAGRILHLGEDPTDVMPFRSNPKTLSFAHNIHDPSDSAWATIDGRAFDTMTNRVRPWEYSGRGISNADLVTAGRESRYEHARNIVQAAAAQMGVDPSAAQAISWEHVKYGIELAGLTKKGEPRKQGPERLGQPYFHPRTGEPAAHDIGAFEHLLSRNFVSPHVR